MSPSGFYRRDRLKHPLPSARASGIFAHEGASHIPHPGRLGHPAHLPRFQGHVPISEPPHVAKVARVGFTVYLLYLYIFI